MPHVSPAHNRQGNHCATCVFPLAFTTEGTVRISIANSQLLSSISRAYNITGRMFDMSDIVSPGTELGHIFHTLLNMNAPHETQSHQSWNSSIHQSRKKAWLKNTHPIHTHKHTFLYQYMNDGWTYVNVILSQERLIHSPQISFPSGSVSVSPLILAWNSKWSFCRSSPCSP